MILGELLTGVPLPQGLHLTSDPLTLKFPSAFFDYIWSHHNFDL